MEDYYCCNYGTRSHVPAFGSWDWNSDLPFTQCFESASRQAAGLLRYSYSEDRDLYVAGDLYENDVVTPAMIVVPRRRGKVRHPRGAREEKKQQQQQQQQQSWMVNGVDVKEPPSPNKQPSSAGGGFSPMPMPPPPHYHHVTTASARPTPKPVDEDLYKISPELLYSKSKKKSGWGLFSSCLLPTCVL